MKQQVIQKKSNSEITFFPRIIREFEDDDEPMYYGAKAWQYYFEWKIIHMILVLHLHLQISKRN